MFWVPFFSLVLLAREGRKEGKEAYIRGLYLSKFTRSSLRRERTPRFERTGNKSRVLAALFRTRWTTTARPTSTDANEPRTSVVGSRHSLIVRPSERASERPPPLVGRSGNRQPSLHSNVVLYAVRQGDERGDGREQRGGGKGAREGADKQGRKGKEGVRLEIG